MSTLSRGNEIEQDFYNLKSQEWGCSRQEAKDRILMAFHNTAQVYVVMGNDFPECVFATKQAAEAFCKKKRLEQKAQNGPHIYWRVYEFKLLEGTPAK